VIGIEQICVGCGETTDVVSRLHVDYLSDNNWEEITDTSVLTIKGGSPLKKMRLTTWWRSLRRSAPGRPCPPGSSSPRDTRARTADPKCTRRTSVAVGSLRASQGTVTPPPPQRLEFLLKRQNDSNSTHCNFEPGCFLVIQLGVRFCE
jgi:hypothetical protein